MLEDVIGILEDGKILPEKYKDCRECHITPDCLLIYQIDGNELILYLTGTGTNCDLF